MKSSLIEKFRGGFATGVGIAAGLLTTGLFAVTVSGAWHAFYPGDIISSGKINDNFNTLRGAIESVNDVPVGTIAAWHKSIMGSYTLPAGWIECNGGTVSDANWPINGEPIPNLNGGGHFLRGAMTSGDMQNDAFQGHLHGLEGRYFIQGGEGETPGVNALKTVASLSDTLSPVTDGTNGTPRTADETRPKNMSVVWIMKIK